MHTSTWPPMDAGISLDGIAPPEKPLGGLFKEAWILPSAALAEVEIRESVPSIRRGRRRLRIRIGSGDHPMDWYIMSPALYRRFGDRQQADRFLDLLARVGRELKEKGSPLTRDEAKRVLGV